MSKSLVAYFSATGTTAKAAKHLSDALNADLFEIIPEQPYTASDLNWNSSSSRSSVEMNDPASRPAISGIPADLDAYDTIYLGFPIWWYQAPRIIQTFLENCELNGKTMIPFATSGGSGYGKTNEILKNSAPAADWKAGSMLNGRQDVRTLQAWAAKQNKRYNCFSA